MTAVPQRVLRLRSDAHLLARFRGGDDRAFDLLHQRHGATIRSYAAFMLRGTPHDPDDAAQDVFLRAYEALRRDDRPVEVRPWLFRVAHNRCVDVLRRPATAELLDHHHVATGDLQVGHEQREALRAMLRDIGALPERQRSALLLRELGGLSHEAVADALGITVSASKMLVVRARLALTEAADARSAACDEVRLRLAETADAGQRPSRADARHLKQCPACAACQRARASLERELALLPGGGAGLLGLLTALGGGGGGKAAAALCCAIAGAGALTTTNALRPEQAPATAQADPAPHAVRHRRPAAPPAVTVAAPVRPAPTAPSPAPGGRQHPGTASAAPAGAQPAGSTAPAAPAPPPEHERILLSDLDGEATASPQEPPTAPEGAPAPSDTSEPDAGPTKPIDTHERIDLATPDQGGGQRP
ncbi:MAG TPA: RNA polymerase sigma factor [Baekduia sp.]|nr:RNA polymerase sigma factor [Baekduia sp.]